MGQTLQISDELYRALQRYAEARRETPEEALAALLQSAQPRVGAEPSADSPTGAPRLYTRAGMQVDQNIALYRKELRPGKDYSTLAAVADV
jgi:hypothetical protein